MDSIDDVYDSTREPREGTAIYRGAELVWTGHEWRVWWLPISGLEGFIGACHQFSTAKALVDRALDPR